MKKQVAKNFIFVMPLFRVGELVAYKYGQNYWHQGKIVSAILGKGAKNWTYWVLRDTWDFEENKIKQIKYQVYERDIKKI
jgi:hypothetical protein